MTRVFRILLLLSVLLLCSVFSFAGTQNQPVLVLLYSRFDDHVTYSVGEERLFRLIKLIEKLRKDYPAYPVKVSCEFSGAFAEQLTKTPTAKGYLKQLHELADAGIVDIGYIGENEPTYRNRPRARLSKGMTAEQRWLEQYQAAKQFLNDYKDPLTGQADAARPGAVKAVTEILGKPAIFGTFAPAFGAEAPYFHELRRMNIQAIMPGFPDPYFTLGIHGYRLSTTELGAKAMVPVPQACSELLWDNNFLRASFTSSADIRGLSASEGKDALAAFLGKLDRSRVRLLQIEVVGYSRYLNKWPDGTPKLNPLAWAYDHPDDPEIPSGIRVFMSLPDVQKEYDSEEQTLRWLLSDFLPENPGSQIVGPKDLMNLARTPVGSDVSAATLTEAVKDWQARSSKEINMSATYVQAGGNYYSAADLFQLLVNNLAAMARDGKRPEKVRLTDIYGPILLEEAESTSPTVEVPAREVMRIAATLAPELNDQTWKPVPSNAVPHSISVGGTRANPAQFLAMIIDAYLAPSPDTPIRLRYLLPLTGPGYMFPRQNETQDGGNIWTLRPAVLKLE